MRPVSTTESFTRNMTLELDESEQFDLTVRGRPVWVTGMALRWTRFVTVRASRTTTWSLRVVNIRKDGSHGASRSVTSWDVLDCPEIVTQALADLAPEWFE